MKRDLPGLIQEGKIILGDGATGTQLMERGLELSECPEEWNLSKPDAVREIHRSYFDAGADFATSNTFGGNRRKLEFFNHHDKVVEFNTYGVNNVNAVKPEGRFCFASMGPTGLLLEPYGDLKFDEAVKLFSDQAAILERAGADAILIETMIDTEEAYAAARASLAATNLPVIVSFTFNVAPSGIKTMMGASPSDVIYRFRDLDLLAVGSNCGCGIEDMIKIMREFRSCTYLPLIAQPNAGMPEVKDGKNVYSETPEYMGEKVRELLEIGVNIIGGCCGTTPQHISRFKKEIREWEIKT